MNVIQRLAEVGAVYTDDHLVLTSVMLAIE